MQTIRVGMALVLFLSGCSSDAASPPSPVDDGATEGGGNGGAGGANGAGVASPGAGGAASSRAGSSGVAVASGGIGTSAGGLGGGAAGTPTGAGGVKAEAGGAGAGTGGAPPACSPSAVAADQVIFIGDSFIAAPTSEIAPDLEQLFQRDGSPGYSPSPRYYQLVGTTMAQISAQYDTAHNANPNIKVVIGDGGGNNVLINDRSCLTQAPPANAGCTKTVTDALDLADKLFLRMETDGVEHVVFFFYPHERTEGVYQGTAPAINDTLDYTEPLARAVCAKHSICLFVSLREASGDAPGSGYTDRGYINPNDVHPSPLGSQFFAEAIWGAMKQSCILTKS